MGRKALESVYQNLPKKERGEILHVGFGHKFLRPINISLKIYHFVTIGELCDINNWKILLTNKPGRVDLKRRGWYNIENPEGFLNKNTVAGRQLPVLAHQRIFAVSAYLPGIMDTAQNGRMSDYTGCVPAFAGANASFWGETNQFFIIRKDCESGCVRPVGSAATHKEDCGGSGEERHSRVLENRIRPAGKCWARRLA